MRVVETLDLLSRLFGFGVGTWNCSSGLLLWNGGAARYQTLSLGYSVSSFPWLCPCRSPLETVLSPGQLLACPNGLMAVCVV
jgi:hypothetical protein